MTDHDATTTVAPEEEEIDLDAWLDTDEPGSDMGEAYHRAAEDGAGSDTGAETTGPRVSDAYRSGS